MYYAAIDKWNQSNDSLAHYKYLKKIKLGPYTRYFYSMKDLQEYYNAAKNARNNELKKEHYEGEVRSATLDNIENVVNKTPTSDFFGKQRIKGAVRKAWHKNNRNQIRIAGNYLATPFDSAIETGKFAVKNMLGSKSRKEAKSKEVSSYKKYKKKQANRSRKRQRKLSNMVTALHQKV